MKLAGRVVIAAPREEVWAFLLDPGRLGPCLPGVEAIERLADGRFRARARIGAGLFSTMVEVVGEYAQVEPPNSATMTAGGSGLGSSGEATAQLALATDEAGGTVVEWTAELTLAGMAAAFEGRLADGTAERAVAGAFDCVRARLEA